MGNVIKHNEFHEDTERVIVGSANADPFLLIKGGFRMSIIHATVSACFGSNIRKSSFHVIMGCSASHQLPGRIQHAIIMCEQSSKRISGYEVLHCPGRRNDLLRAIPYCRVHTEGVRVHLRRALQACRYGDLPGDKRPVSWAGRAKRRRG